jgi:tetratricopeptide (TPR) repeat protein
MRNKKGSGLPLFLLMVSWAVSCQLAIGYKSFPATTDSEGARLMYEKAEAYFEKLYIPEAIHQLEKALEEDPDFFMAAYGLATHHLYADDREAFVKYAEQAVRSSHELSMGEDLLKAALQQLLLDEHSDVTETGRELVRRYRDVPDAYFHLAFFQEIIGDHQGQVETLLKALEIKEAPATIYNSLGYSYMDLGQFDQAAKALDKYLELKPEEPNPYDSKGDYFMAVKEYAKAYDSYSKAFAIDSTWTGSLRKANRARAMIGGETVQ